ncbi:MAG TPA: universal stress protein [Dissulfurispiraceae bacterium]|nr:universal stress protein [Dissulfurispiraceae bacterium]
MNINRILFPTDFSEGALAALPNAVDLAKSYGAKLYLLHVIYDMSMASGLHVPHISLDALYNEMEKSAVKELNNFGAELRRELTGVECKVIRGVPYDEILKFAAGNDIDIIVLGTHGRHGIDRVIFGSTAEKVVRNATCPVLTVRSNTGK